MKLEVLIGMIASGKSTYARKRAREGALVICHDDLTEMLHAEYRYEPALRETYLAMMLGIADRAYETGHDVVVDRTHMTRESRAMWTSFAHQFNRLHANDRYTTDPPVSAVAVLFPVHAPSLHAERRFKADARGRSYETWLQVAHHHFVQFEADPLNWVMERFHDYQEMPRFAEKAIPDANLPALSELPRQ